MKKGILIILFIAFWTVSLAQSSATKFDHFTIVDGLPELSVQFIHQDSQGYIWMGTQSGVLKYDGYKPRVYKLRGNNEFTRNESMTTNVIEDNNKDLWVSTIGNGLFKYNRSEDNFIQIPYPKSYGTDSVSKDYVTAVDLRNNIWAYHSNKNFRGEYYEIIKFNQKSRQYERFNKHQKGNHHLDVSKVYMLTKTKSGQIWIGTDNGLYLYSYGKDQFIRFLAVGATAKEKVTLVYEAPSEPGILWLNLSSLKTKKRQIVRLDTRIKSFREYGPSSIRGFTRENDTVNAIFETQDKQLWFATMNGLISIDRKSAVFTKYLPTDTNKDPYRNELFGMVESNDGTLWIKSGRGLLSFDPHFKSFQRFANNPDDPFSISSDFLVNVSFSSDNILVDKSGILWVSSLYSGVNKVNQLTSAFTSYSKDRWGKSNYPGGITRCIKYMPDGYCWFSTSKGYFKWLPESDKIIKLYTAKNIADSFSAFDVSTGGVLYFSTEDGFCVLDIKTNKLHQYSNIPGDSTSLSSNKINAILLDHTGTVWIGTEDAGLCAFNPVTHKFRRYPFKRNNAMLRVQGPLDDVTVCALYEDKAGTLWVGTNFGGLSRYNRKTGKFKSYLYAGDTRVFVVQAMYEDEKGRFWIGTYLHGLYQFNRETERYISNYNEESGLLFNNVSSLTSDQDGILWALSLRGLSRIDPVKRSVTNFPLRTALPNQQLTGLASNNMISYKDKIILSFVGGFSVFQPSTLTGNRHPPMVHIEKVAYSNPRSSGNRTNIFHTYSKKSLSLPWKDNRVSFNYIALHFANPVENTYAYFLKGYDKHWVQAGTSRSVTYNNLSPGTYTFSVKAANSDGVWNTKGDSFVVIIRSPWWLRWWAWVLYILSFVGAMYVFVLFRSKALRKENEHLERRVALKVKQLEAAQQQLIQSEKLASLGELTAGIAHEIQNPLNFVNNFSEVSIELVDELEAELEIGDMPEARLIATDVKQNLSKIRHHGMRADGIVKSMLEHSRATNNVKATTNINKLADEYLRLAYHGFRAKESGFNSKLTTNFQESLPEIDVVQQDLGRVMLNLFNNAFYAVNQKSKTANNDSYSPEVTVSTCMRENMIYIEVKDNGKGVAEAIKEKIMQPFFTTKPTGEGTGLGLSLSYDIIVHGLGGTITVDSRENEYAVFTVKLPVHAASS